LRDIKVLDDAVRHCSRIFAALFREHERRVGLIIPKTAVRCRRNFGHCRQTGGLQRSPKSSRKLRLKSFHRGTNFR
jgi:hypothetical protein